jgi:uncharacterized Ntn-hydrolase superfamily protein
VASAVPAVGSICPYIRPGIGVVSTQSWVNPYLAIDILAALESGVSAKAALASALAGDTDRDQRQLGVVDAAGEPASWTGAECTSWAGEVLGSGFAVQGNMLVGPDTLTAMEVAFLSKADAALSKRLMSALEAGDIAGGDKRGKQSAALKVFEVDDYPMVDLRSMRATSRSSSCGASLRSPGRSSPRSLQGCRAATTAHRCRRRSRRCCCCRPG